MNRPFTRQAERELREAASWIAKDNRAAARTLLNAALVAAELITTKPALARVRPELAPERYRFWPLRGFPYLLVLDFGSAPPKIARFVHQARDLHVLLGDLRS